MKNDHSKNRPPIPSGHDLKALFHEIKREVDRQGVELRRTAIRHKLCVAMLQRFGAGLREPIKIRPRAKKPPS